MAGRNGELQNLTNRLVERATAYGVEGITEQSKIMTDSTNNISIYIGMNGQNLQEVINLKYLGATHMKRWLLLSRSPHQDCLNNSSNGQTKEDLLVQHYQLCKQVQAVQVSYYLPPHSQL